MLSHRPDQASAPQPPQQADANGSVELDPQLKSALGKSSDITNSKIENGFGVEFFDAGEQSIFEGDDMELVGMLYLQKLCLKFSFILVQISGSEGGFNSYADTHFIL